MTYDHWKTTNPADEWMGEEPLSEIEKKLIAEAVEEMRPRIEGSARPESDYTQDADDIMLI